jgi:hypothetical protein
MPVPTLKKASLAFMRADPFIRASAVGVLGAVLMLWGLFIVTFCLAEVDVGVAAGAAW